MTPECMVLIAVKVTEAKEEAKRKARLWRLHHA